jgi:hypothetical protein
MAHKLAFCCARCAISHAKQSTLKPVYISYKLTFPEDSLHFTVKGNMPKQFKRSYTTANTIEEIALKIRFTAEAILQTSIPSLKSKTPWQRQSSFKLSCQLSESSFYRRVPAYCSQVQNASLRTQGYYEPSILYIVGNKHSRSSSSNKSAQGQEGMPPAIRTF